MQYLRILVLLSVVQFSAYAQQYSNFIPNDRIVDWSKAGVEGGIPRNVDLEINFQILRDANPAVSDFLIFRDVALIQARSYRNAHPIAWVSIYFPAGTYTFDQGIQLGLQDSNLFVRGAGSSNSIFNFNVTNGNLFTISGNGPSAFVNLDVVQGFAKGSITIKTISAMNEVSNGDWIELVENNGPWIGNYDGGTYDPSNGNPPAQAVGQIIRVRTISADKMTLTLYDELRLSYHSDQTPRIGKIAPARNIGFENVTINSQSNTTADGGPSNFNFGYAVDCWISGVASYHACSAHVGIGASSNIEVRGCWFHDATAYGAGGHGYGVSIGGHSTNCLVENNIFSTLRHAMIVSRGANGNVFGYNFSRDAYCQDCFPFREGDISIHGHYAYANLFEGNTAEYVVADNWWGDNGPYNTFFRNRITDVDIVLEKADYTNAVGNELGNEGAGVDYVAGGTFPPDPNRDDGSANIIDVFGYYLEVGFPQFQATHVQSTVNDPYNVRDWSFVNRASYYRTTRPDFIPGSYTWPPMGPAFDFDPFTEPLDDLSYRSSTSHSIPGQARWESDPRTVAPPPVVYRNLTVPGMYPTIGEALAAASTGQTVEVTGSQNVTGYLTVNSGITLQLNAGSSLLFTSASTRLLVNGALNVNGTSSAHVTLDGQGYSRSGSSMALVVVASGGTASIQYADSKNASYELTLYNSTGSISIQNCTFTNFGYNSTDQAITVQTKISGSATISSSTITGSNSQGAGIYLYNTGTNVILSSNTITNAGTGIRCSSSDAFLTNNTIHNHTNYGIQADNVSSSAQYRGNDIRSCVYGMSLSTASPWVMYNIVIQNGLNVLVNSCSPSFATLPSEGDNSRGHNTIAHAGSPLLKAQYSAFPYLGYDFDGGYNSIFDSDLPDGWVVNNSGLYAANNYWTNGYPSCYADGTSWALTTTPLASNPNTDPLGRMLVLGPGGNLPSMLAKTGTTSCDSTKDREFQTTLSAAVHGDLSAAVPGLQTLIHSASPKYAPLALLVYYDLGSGRWNSAGQLGHTKTEMYSLLQDLRSQPVSTLLRPFALRLLARDAAVSRNNGLANTYRNEILKDYNHSDHELVTMYDLVVYYVEAEIDFKEAKAIVKKMKHAYPDANLTYMARIEIGEKVTLPVLGEQQPSTKLQDSGPLAMKVEDVPTNFSLSQNYPNPFNPTTIIQFTMPAEGQAKLRIFDMLGREMAVLLDGFKAAGTHTVSFDASQLSSGIYVYRFESGGKAIVKKMSLVR